MPRMPVFWQSLLVWPDPRSSFISSWQRLERIRSCLWVTSFLVSSLQLRSLFFLLSLQFLQLWISVSTTPTVIWWHPTNTPQCHTLSSAFAASFASACRVQHGTIHWVELIFLWPLTLAAASAARCAFFWTPLQWSSFQSKNIYQFLLWAKNSVMSCNKFTTGFGVNKVVVHGCRLLTTVGQRMQGYANVTCATRAFVCVLPRSIFSGRFCCLRSRKKHITIYHVSGTLHLFK